ncbi:hypothetical protein N5D52_14815 [Pseudomonas sp. GD03860]|uniref:hypothetical protein n=1 Tax=Pseudomonas sp. GD03860 TaxID=2975389 RepID=UPI002447566C|nr:hypothetical protein [Pseudomonas sp. GD03860]MDH0638217.1 hypothetical protein [Pseudomonas sp. GD03860]
MQLTELAGSAVAVYPAFRRVLGLSASAAQFLSQAVYWTEKTGDGWFYKTESEWEQEIGLSSKEVRTARRCLSGLQLLEEVRKGVPAKMHFRVDTDLLLEYLGGEKDLPVLPKEHNKTCPKGTTGSTQKAELVLPKGADKCDRNGTTITEITQETTTETTALVHAPASPKRAAKSSDAEQARQDACRGIWSAYSIAYQARYGADPVRNAKINRQVVDLWKRLGAEAAEVAAYFVSINDSYLIRNCHDLGSLLSKCESYRTQWATGRQVNGTTARQIEQKQANLNAGMDAAQRIMESAGGRDNEFL